MLENGAVFYVSLEIVRRLIELGRKDAREALAKAGLARGGRWGSFDKADRLSVRGTMTYNAFTWRQMRIVL